MDALTWRELGDAVWLAAAMRKEPVHRPEDPPPSRPPKRQEHPIDRPRPSEPAAEDPPAVAPRSDVAGKIRTPQVRQDTPPPARVELRAPKIFLAETASGFLDVVKALRPLKRRVPDRRDDHVILDEDATAERAMQDGFWLPVTTADTVRWLDLTLVVDMGPSMRLWQPEISTFVTQLEQLGAFRSIQIRLLDTNSHAGPILRGGTRNTRARRPAELVDRSGRRAMLVVTDGIGDSWLSDTVSPTLALWGATMPVCVVHLLSERLWGREGLNVNRVQLYASGPMLPNRRWRTAPVDDPRRDRAGAVPVPILELNPRWLGWWASLITGNQLGPASAPVLFAGPEPSAMPAAQQPADIARLTPRERVWDFVRNASPIAQRLAALLAAAPVRLDVARLLQQELVPESQKSHLVEILLGGLLRVSGNDDECRDWDVVTFDFHDGVRQQLLQGATRSDTARVIRLVADHDGNENRAFDRIRNALDQPDSDIPNLASANKDLTALELESAVMTALSGSYLGRSRKLLDMLSRSSRILNAAGHVDPSGSVSTTTKPIEDDMAQPELQREPSSLPKAESKKPNSGAAPPTPGDTEVRMAKPPPNLRDELPERVRGERVPPVWGDVPPRNLLFTGRDELLNQLGHHLSAGGTTAVLPSALHGMGGIGKTQMAVEYIYRHLNDYDVVWWIQAAQVSQVRKALTELAQQLEIPGTSEMHVAVPAVREALRLGKPYPRWLLVFDAAENVEDISDYFPQNGPGQILITSRNPDWAHVARPLEITVFERDESVALLRKRGPEISDSEANALADKLGDLPLAVEQAAAWRAETGMPVSEYLRLFDEKVTEILGTSAPTGYEMPVAAAWNVSFDELEKRNPAAHQLLQVCAYFAPEPITRMLFTGGIRISISPALDSALREPMQLGRAIRDINRYSLAKIDHRTNTLQLHRLVQLVLRNRMSKRVRADMQHGAHTLLANFDPNEPTSSQWWPRYQDIWPHIYACDPFTCEEPWTRELVINVIQFLYFWGDHHEAAALAQKALTQWTELFGESDSQALDAASYLGLCLWALGRYPEAAELNEHTLELLRQVSGDDSEETIIAELRVAVDVRTAGDFARARDLNEAIYEKARALYGDDDPITLQTAHDLAVSVRLSGDYEGAFELNRHTSARRGEVLGYDSVDTLNTLSGMYMDRRELGDYNLARDEHERILRRVKELLGEDKADTLRRQAYLAVARRKAGDHDGARNLSKEAIELFRRRYGDDHPQAMACAIGYSIDLRHAEDLEGARSLGEQTFERFRAKFGENHPHTLAAAVDLAVTLRLKGDPVAARQLNERSLERLRKTLGPDHPYSIVCAIDLASDLAALDEPAAALALGSEVRERVARTLGEDHPTTLAASLNVALDLDTLGRTEEADTLYADTIARYRRQLGESHPGTVAASERIRANCDIDPLPT
jgi:tetratricopeptide (TPR) repeat protein